MINKLLEIIGEKYTLNQVDVDLPLYSYDRIFAAGNDTLIVELYDTMVNSYEEGALAEVKVQYADLCERDPGVHWYEEIKLDASISKKGKKAQTSRFDELTVKHFKAYLSSSVPTSEVSIKQKKAAYYVDGLLEKGGPSTDVFKKASGVEATTRLFKKVLFGTTIV